MARLPMLDETTAAPEVAELFRKLKERGMKVMNIHRVMGNSPVFLAWFGFINALLNRVALDPKARELGILRVASLTGSKYEWQMHEPLALEFGITPEQVAAIAQWERSQAFDERERAILRYIDAVTHGVDVDDETFAGVRALFNDRELVELTLTIGFYGLVARFLGAMQVDLERDVSTEAEVQTIRKMRDLLQ